MTAAEKPLRRMLLYIGMKMETLEIRYSDKNDDGTLKWCTEMARQEHAIMDEIHKTLTLLELNESEFKQILRRKMGPRRK